MSEIKVVIKWEKIDPWSEVLEKNEKDDYGIYQITGHHPVFGHDSLLYIGKAQDQTFGTRIKQHKDWLENKELDVTIYIGRIASIDDENNKTYHDNRWRPVIESAEPLLIYFHSPPYNSQHISEAPEPTTELRIINTGDCGMLYPEISHKGLGVYDNKQRPSD